MSNNNPQKEESSDRKTILRRVAQRWMDLVLMIDSTEYLVDVTTIDANNPSSGFLRGSKLSPAYFPGAASVIATKRKWDKYRFLMKGPQQQLVPFVLEVQGRWSPIVQASLRKDLHGG